MDPFTVSTACVGLLAAVAQLSTQIGAFVSGVREARRDMESVSRELVSLSSCLEALRDDARQIEYPDGLQQPLLAVIKNCDLVTKDMLDLLQKLASGNLGTRIQWTTYGRNDMNKLRLSLETHKSALDIALDVTTLLITSAVKADAETIKADTAVIRSDVAQISLIKQDTAQIGVLVQEIASLRQQVNVLQRADNRGSIVLQRFLDDTDSYAESVLGEPTVSPLEPKQHALPWHVTESQTADTNSNRSGMPDVLRIAGSAVTSALDVTISTRSQNNHNLPIRATSSVGQGLLSAARQPDGAVMNNAATTRSSLTPKQRQALDEECEMLIRGQKNTKDRLLRRESWVGRSAGSIDQIRMALDKGASMSFRAGDALRVEMLGNKRHAVIETLLQYGILQVRPEAWNRELLTNAVENCLDTDTLKLLLDYGADPNAGSLHKAVYKHDIPLIEWLLGHGAEVNRVSSDLWWSHDQMTPFELLCEKHRWSRQFRTACEVAMVLIKNGARMTHKCSEFEKLFLRPQESLESASEYLYRQQLGTIIEQATVAQLGREDSESLALVDL